MIKDLSQMTSKEITAYQIERAKRKNLIERYCYYGNHVIATEKQLHAAGIHSSKVICRYCHARFAQVEIPLDD